MARRPVTASYRLQLRPSFTFDDAAAVAPYLADLGLSHVYTSPFLAAAAGSEHGYDVVDPTRVREDLGGAAGFDRFVTALQANGLGLIVDVVPHHMSIQGSENRWWWEVLDIRPAGADGARGSTSTGTAMTSGRGPGSSCRCSATTTDARSRTARSDWQRRDRRRVRRVCP